MTSEPLALVPERIGPYLVEREIGRGGMGVVYRALDTRLDRPVAIKALPPDLVHDPERLARFQREAKILASLNHPNIATIHGMEEDELGRRYLVLEWLPGETLARRLTAGPLSASESLAVCRQIADALGAAHEGGVTHRDVKPQNVMILPRGRIKVVDFGLARRIEPVESLEANSPILESHESSEGMGTASYMSPERVLGRAEDHRADLFAFGCVLYECLAGRRAFEGATLFGTLSAVLRSRPELSFLPASVPDRVRDLIVSCLQRRPEDRPTDMDAVMHVLAGEASGGQATTFPGEFASAPWPRVLTSFVGRLREIAECERLLTRTRLVTLTGPGGCGKTRLALRVAESATAAQAEAWIRFVDLAALSDGQRVLPAVAAALGLREETGEALLGRIADLLGPDRALLLIDNCEHVLEGAAETIRGLIDRCPSLRILATSRQALAVTGEQIFVVSPLEVPTATEAGLDRLSGNECVRLFLDRALLADPGFVLSAENAAAVALICRRVEGIPLGIEMAASRLRVLTPQEIAQHLDRQLRFLRSETDTTVRRHETMRATIQWSVDCLSEAEQRTFRELAAFAGGCGLEAATFVCGASDEFEMLDRIAKLVDKSLLTVERRKGEISRYRFLEPIRQFAVEALAASGDEGSVRGRHLDWFLDLAERAESELYGPAQADWLATLEQDHENLLAAIERCLRAGEVQKALRLGGSLWRFWYIHGHAWTGKEILDRVLAAPGAEARTLGRARALFAQGAVWLGLALPEEGDNQQVESYRSALELFRELGDRAGAARCLAGLGLRAVANHRHEEGRAYLQEAAALYQEVGDRRGLATATGNMGLSFWLDHDAASALPHFERVTEIYREVGDSYNFTTTCIGISLLRTRSGDLPASRRALLEGVETARKLEATSNVVAGLLLAAAELAEASSRLPLAAIFFGAAEGHLLRIRFELTNEDPWWFEHDQAIERIRRSLGEEELARRRAEGSAMACLESLEFAAREMVAPGPAVAAPLRSE